VLQDVVHRIADDHLHAFALQDLGDRVSNLHPFSSLAVGTGPAGAASDPSRPDLVTGADPSCPRSCRNSPAARAGSVPRRLRPPHLNPRPPAAPPVRARGRPTPARCRGPCAAGARPCPRPRASLGGGAPPPPPAPPPAEGGRAPPARHRHRRRALSARRCPT